MTPSRHSHSLFLKIAVVITAITVAFWLVASYAARQMTRSALQSEFSRSTTRIMRAIAQQSRSEIKYADYFQIQRLVRDVFDESYMRYLTIQAAEGELLALFPKQIDGETYKFLEQHVAAHASEEASQSFLRFGGEPFFHFQMRIADEEGTPIGLIAMGGTMRPIEAMLKTQTILFAAFGLAILLLQIGAIVYASYFLTKPLAKITRLLRQTEGEAPEKFMPALLTCSPPKGASSEIHLFWKAYQGLLQNISAHQLHERAMAVHASIGTIASHIAHDMRSPLSVLKGFAGMIAAKKDPARDPAAEEFVGAAVRSVQKLNRMADELVDYSRAKQLQPSPASIPALLRNVAGECSPAGRDRGIEIEVSSPEELTVRCDEYKINRVVTNLVHNSIQAVRQLHGRIRVTASVKEGGWLLITVQDNGCGIDPKHLPNLFDSSFSIGKLKGTGLGLSYCKNVVEAHGGRIWVESVPDKGSSFFVEIPLATVAQGAQEGPAAASAEALPSTPIPASARTILVADDDDGILLQWKEFIRTYTPFEVVTASSPEEVERLAPKPSRFRAAIVDYHYEGYDKNGLDLVRYLKAQGIPCLYICSAYYYDPKLLTDARAAGAHTVIPKPIPDGLVKQLFT